jgi:MFS superfamily sulfate permease-like transporter
MIAMFEIIFQVLRIVFIVILMYTFAQLFQQKPVATWAAWLSSALVVSMLATAATDKIKKEK